MDTIAHALWSFIVFHRTEFIGLAILIGILPDLLSWAVFAAYPKKNGFNWKKPDLKLIPNWVYTLYGISHSLFVIAIVFFVVYLVSRTIPVYLFAWPLHVLIDIPTHRRDFLPTPFLWPFSDWAFPGISWGTKYFMIVNYAMIILFLVKL